MLSFDSPGDKPNGYTVLPATNQQQYILSDGKRDFRSLSKHIRFLGYSHQHCGCLLSLFLISKSEWGGGDRGSNLLLPVPFNPGACPSLVGSRLLALYRFQNMMRCCVLLFFSSDPPPPFESCFPHLLLLPTAHFPSLFSRSLSPPPCPT